jgi:site-specific recombinase XerD
MDQVVLHTTRHTGATKMVKAGKNAFQIARVTGHKTLSVLQKYTHLAGQDAIDLANEVLANVGTEKP